MSRIPPPPSGDVKRRKVLGELNTTRRKSLGFELVKITMSPPKHKYKNTSLLPPPSVPPKLERFTRLKNSLDDKARVHSSERSNAKNLLDQKFGQQLQRTNETQQHALIQELKEAKIELKTAQEDTHKLQYDCEELRREQKRLERLISDKTAEIDQSKMKFEYKGDMLLTKIGNFEKTADMRVEELSNKLKREFNEAKFEHERELKNSVAYMDEDLAQELETLKQQRDELVELHELTVSENKLAIAKESESLQQEVSQYLEKPTRELKDITLVLHEKNRELQALVYEATEVDKQLTAKREEKSKLQDTLTKLNDHGKYETRRAQLKNELAEVQSTVQESKTNYDALLKKHSSTDALYNTTADKLTLHNHLRRVLENSIMDHQKKIRVYLRVPSEARVDADNELFVDGAMYTFNKVLKRSIPTSDFVDEYLCLVKNVVKGMDVSLVVLGSNENARTLLCDTVQSSFTMFKTTAHKAWSYKYSIGIINTNDGECDEEHFETEEQLQSLLTSIFNSDVPSIVLGVKATNLVTLKSFATKLTMVNLTDLSISNQYDVLSDRTDGYKVIINSYHNKCLHICDVPHFDQEYIHLVELLQQLNRTRLRR